MCRVGAGLSLPSRRLDPGQRLAERVEPAAGGAELVAVLVVVLLEPARADAEDQPAAADVVDGAGHVGQQLGVAVAVARHEGADLDLGRRLGPGAEHRPALEVLALGLAVQRVEVVPVEDDVRPELLRLRRRAADVRVRGVLRLELDTDPDLSLTHAPHASPASAVRHAVPMTTPLLAPPGSPPGTLDAQRLRALRRMQAVALGLLLLAAVVYVLTFEDEGFLGYVNAGAEASMVGAVADWFAVTALFRRPLGLPIPHTALVPERKDALGESLEQFVTESFLTPRPRPRPGRGRGAGPAGRAVDLAGAERRPGRARGRAGAGTGAARHRRGRGAGLRRAGAAAPAGAASRSRPVAGHLLENVLRDGAHRPLVDLVLVEGHAWLVAARGDGRRRRARAGPVVVAVLARRPRGRPGLPGDAALGRRRPRRPRAPRPGRARLAAGPVRRGPAARRGHPRAGRGAQGAGAGEPRHRRRRHGGRRVGARPRSSSRSPTSTVRCTSGPGGRWSTWGSGWSPTRGCAPGWTPAPPTARPSWSRPTAPRSPRPSRTPSRGWDGKEASRRIELLVGRDLQFIRINGTVVGGLVGVTIHAVSQLL